jgi:formate hydrogenlyase transcriptional activator
VASSPIVFASGNPKAPDLPNQLADPEHLIAAYWQSATVGIGVLDRDFKYVSVNDTLARFNGLPASAHLQKTLREIVGDNASQIEPVVLQVLSEGMPILDVPVTGPRPNRDGHGQWLVHFYPIRNESGEAEKVCAIVFDKTEQSVLRERFNQLQDRLSVERERLQMLLEVNRITSSNWDVATVLPKISARIRRVLHHEYAAMALHDPETGLLIRQAVDFPLSKGFTSDVQISTHNSASGRALSERKASIYSKDELQAFEGETAQRFLAEGIQSMCCIPMIRPTGALGVLSLGSTRKDAFSSNDLALLEQVAMQFAIAIENRRIALEVEALKQRLGEERKYLNGTIHPHGQFSEIIGDSPALRKVLADVVTVASSDATVLILGETGTGKELIARAIHRMSRLKEGPFIKLNCAAIPTGLLESELFGHERGAFTGAISQKVGRMELADGGTLFLDEVGEISLELQPKLLRVLQDQEFERLGSNRTIRVKVRLVAATNRDLAEGVAQHQFRSDLFYRLNVFPIVVPPLRERRDDIPLLVRYFVHKFSVRMGRQIESVSTETIKALSRWHWPGNIRELENLMERSVILTEGKTLRVPLSELRSVAEPAHREFVRTLDDAERQHIIGVLRETRGVISGPNGAAQRLGLKRTTLQSKMQRLGIHREDYAESET